jgi:hypothetical protein
LCDGPALAERLIYIAAFLSSTAIDLGVEINYALPKTLDREGTAERLYTPSMSMSNSASYQLKQINFANSSS